MARFKIARIAWEEDINSWFLLDASHIFFNYK